MIYNYKRNPLISLIRERIILQLQLITPGNVSIVVCKKSSISLLEAATACTCNLFFPVQPKSCAGKKFSLQTNNFYKTMLYQTKKLYQI